MFEYRRKGTSKAGAPIYRGKWQKPPLLLGVLCAVETVFLLFGLVVVLCNWNASASIAPRVFGASRHFMLGCGLIFYSIATFSFARSALWIMRTRYRLRRLQAADKICTQFGMDDSVFHTWRQEQQIKPYININGTDYYRPADFKEAGTLLRASTQPTTAPNTLLRPALLVEQAAPEQLLRAAE